MTLSTMRWRPVPETIARFALVALVAAVAWLAFWSGQAARADWTPVADTGWEIDIPDDFRPMTPTEIRTKYPAGGSTIAAAYTVDSSLGVTLAFGTVAMPAGREDPVIDTDWLDSFYNTMSRGARQRGMPNIGSLGNALVEIDGVTWGEVRMRVDTPGGATVNIMMLLITEGTMVIAQVNATEDRWQTQAEDLTAILYGMRRG